MAEDLNDAETEQEQGLKAQAKKQMQAVTAYVDDSQVPNEMEGKDLTFLQKLSMEPIIKKDSSNVTIDPETLAVVMDELDMSRIEAEKLLRANNGQLEAAIQAFVG